MLGRLKRTLKEKCPECGKVLQIRLKSISEIREGENIITEKEYICCSNKNCDYERNGVQKRRRNKSIEDL